MFPTNLGMLNALRKPTILLARRGQELPFDIRSYRVIFYDDTIGGKTRLEETLEKTPSFGFARNPLNQAWGNVSEGNRAGIPASINAD